MIPDVEGCREWIPLVDEQQRMLIFASFTQRAALQFVSNCQRLADEQYHKPVAASVVLDGVLVALAMMDGTDLYNQYSLVAKGNASAHSGASSMMAFLQAKYSVSDDEASMLKSGNTMVCGGCVPIWVEDSIRGYATVSNMTHEEDHQMCVDALAMVKGIKVKSILC